MTVREGTGTLVSHRAADRNRMDRGNVFDMGDICVYFEGKCYSSKT